MKRLAAAALALSLSACATLSPAPHPESGVRWAAHRAQVAQVHQFTLQGRVAGSGALGVKADLRWQQFADGRFDLRLSGPFGAGALAIIGDANLVEVRSREGSAFTAEPERWLHQHFGWSLPIAGLRYWVLGLPAPDSPAELEFAADGTLVALEQNGWQLQYQDYQTVGSLRLPRRFQAANQDATIRVIADRWEDLPAVAQNP